ncbi:MAG: hypothetical protein QOF72_674 [Blastocatellia bacterium]|nr:hypothetical protein [Blastocatellia bacterium]
MNPSNSLQFPQIGPVSERTTEQDKPQQLLKISEPRTSR